MTPVDRVIELLKDHQETGDREPAVEAHSLLGVFLDVRNENYHKTVKESPCIDCGVIITRKSTKNGRCNICRAKHLKAWQLEHYKKQKEVKK